MSYNLKLYHKNAHFHLPSDSKTGLYSVQKNLTGKIYNYFLLLYL